MEQIGALKQLKNDIIGHEQRKHLVLLRGVVEPLARTLALGLPSSKAGGKRRSAEVNGFGGATGSNQKAGASRASVHGWGEEDEMRLQATLVVGSLAHGIVEPNRERVVARLSFLTPRLNKVAATLPKPSSKTPSSLPCSPACLRETTPLDSFSRPYRLFSPLLRRPRWKNTSSRG